MKLHDVEIIQPLERVKGYFFMKRLFDIILGFLLLIISSPLLLLICFLLYIDDGFPIIFRQIRVGKDGKQFVMMKFRTMPCTRGKGNKNKQIDYSQWKNGVPDDFIFKSSSPTNATRLGKFLRKTSLDELPQLINVIKGEMSLIGPRPEVPAIAKYYNHEQKGRLLVKPGITGYAQIKGRSDINHGKKIMYDRYYINTVSLRFDLKILALTIIRVIKADGNY